MTGLKLPWWTVGVLALLFAPAVVVHEPVFGDGVGLTAAGAGVLVGLVVAALAAWRRWDALTTGVVAVAAYLLLGGAVALRETTIAGLVPSARTVQLLVVQAVMSWKDLLTLAPPAASYVGPAVLPWLAGLACGLASGLLALRSGRYVWATLPIVTMAGIGVAWGPGGAPPPAWPAAIWAVAILGWWAWCGQYSRVGSGAEVLLGRRALGRVLTEDSLSSSLTATGGSVSVVYRTRRIVAALATLALAGGLAVPVVGAWDAFTARTVLRDLIEPPLDVRDYPTPLASFRHYTTGLKTTTLVSLSALPRGARVRLGVMDTYNGIAFGMSDPQQSSDGRFVRVGRDVRETPWTGAGTAADVRVRVTGLSGPWLPSIGVPDTWEFTGEDATALADGLHLNKWSDAALSTAFTGTADYSLHTVVPPLWSDGQLAGVGTPGMTGSADSDVPDGVQELAQEVTAGEGTQLGRARAIERYLNKHGYFSNADAASSRPGHRADRISRMLSLQQMIGDDEQYSVLMALMLHSLGIPARVVTGLYPRAASDGPVELTGDDVHAWVEVPFTGVGWGTFDPTPPRDQVPQTDVPKPRSVPKPQVLQPPEPPEQPVELPPGVSDRPIDEHLDDAVAVPWLLIGGVGGGLLVLLGPLGAIWQAKALRRRRRRNDPDPSLAVPGAWNEAVDRAVDAGVVVPADLTRQETAQLLTDTVWPFEHPAAGWSAAEAELPPVLRLARRADTAVFGAATPTPPDAASAWADTDALSAQLASGAGWFTRARRAVSLRSLRRRRRLAATVRRPPGSRP